VLIVWVFRAVAKDSLLAMCQPLVEVEFVHHCVHPPLERSSTKLVVEEGP
jgi:hypothetical protein